MTTPEPRTIELDEQARNWRDALKVTRAQIAQLEEIEKRCREQLEAYLGDAELATINGQPAIRYTTVTSNRLDTKKLKEERPEVYTAFARPQVSRRFTLIDEASA